MELAKIRRVLVSFCMKTAEMSFSKTRVKFGRSYGNQGWERRLKNIFFVLQINSFKFSESFKSVAQGVFEIFEEVYLGEGHNVPQSGLDMVKKSSSLSSFFATLDYSLIAYHHNCRRAPLFAHIGHIWNRTFVPSTVHAYLCTSLYLSYKSARIPTHTGKWPDKQVLACLQSCLIIIQSIN